MGKILISGCFLLLESAGCGLSLLAGDSAQQTVSSALLVGIVGTLPAIHCCADAVFKSMIGGGAPDKPEAA